MNKINFFTAKDNSLSCLINGIPLHSKYNPKNEGCRFIQNYNFNFAPTDILLIEPGIDYISGEIFNKFPDTKLHIIHFSEEFKDYEKKGISYYYINGEPDLSLFENDFFSKLGEERIFSTCFIQWTPSFKIFSGESELVWNSIKRIISKGQSILNTRNYFSQRWFLNSISFIKNVNKTAILKKIDLPVVVCASGPSLKDMTGILKDKRKKYFLMAVSSALNYLLKNGLIPDLVISTDGGFWAKKHLEPLIKKTDIPLALAVEGNCPKKVLQHNTIIPLTYSDGFASLLIKKSEIRNMEALRNGTVSGTALDLALKLTSGNVFMCGLDLSGAKGNQHCPQNLLEMNNISKDCKINSLEKRQTASRYNSSSLEIYRDWFANLTDAYTKRTFRLSNNFSYSNKLGKIKELNANDFSNMLLNSESFIAPETEINSFSVDSGILRSTICAYSKRNEWLKEFFTSDYISYERNDEINSRNEKIKLIEEKNNKFLAKIDRLL